ncbi:hypothetical protein [Nocardiopsis quinghaiensis]|uniref:hypothetical protein n=1 Tax=Nocardiopsis quinghaiensis TaxID=464995 RepID=UPI00123958FE|nr:hypothetical protein [Nocardiopsis quinghaiensis]
MSEDPYRIDAAHSETRPSPSAPAPRSSRTPGRKALLVLLGVLFVVLAAANATLSLSGEELVGSAFGVAALVSLVLLIVSARRGDR